jgi:hypothetical protein
MLLLANETFDAHDPWLKTKIIVWGHMSVIQIDS